MSPATATIATLDPMSIYPVSITGICDAAGLIKMTVPADAPPSVTSRSDPTQPVMSGPTGSPPHYEFSCRRPPAGAAPISWEMTWTLGTGVGTLATTIPPLGPVILRPKPEGPKYSVGG